MPRNALVHSSAEFPCNFVEKQTATFPMQVISNIEITFTGKVFLNT